MQNLVHAMHKERSSEKRIRAYVQNRKPNSALFRNDNGQAHYRTPAGKDVHIRYGLQPGSGDDVGWTVVEITPDMVGKRLAVFTSCEYKSERTGDGMSDDQRRWHNQVRRDGGISEVWIERRDGTIERATEIEIKKIPKRKK